MPTTHAQLKKRIMRRIYLLWFARRIAPVLFVQLPFFIFLAARETAQEFFVANILQGFGVALRNSHNPLDALWALFTNGIFSHTVPLAIIAASAAIISVLTVRNAMHIRAISDNRMRYSMHERAF